MTLRFLSSEAVRIRCEQVAGRALICWLIAFTTALACFAQGGAAYAAAFSAIAAVFAGMAIGAWMIGKEV